MGSTSPVRNPRQAVACASATPAGPAPTTSTSNTDRITATLRKVAQSKSQGQPAKWETRHQCTFGSVSHGYCVQRPANCPVFTLVERNPSWRAQGSWTWRTTGRTEWTTSLAANGSASAGSSPGGRPLVAIPVRGVGCAHRAESFRRRAAGLGRRPPSDHRQRDMDAAVDSAGYHGVHTSHRRERRGRSSVGLADLLGMYGVDARFDPGAQLHQPHCTEPDGVRSGFPHDH